MSKTIKGRREVLPPIHRVVRPQAVFVGSLRGFAATVIPHVKR